MVVRRMVEPPTSRRLRILAFDPSLATRLETATINEITVEVAWEKLEPGPVGEYIEVVDCDPASGVFYRPVDLDNRTCWRGTGCRHRSRTRSSTSRWSTRSR